MTDTDQPTLADLDHVPPCVWVPPTRHGRRTVHLYGECRRLSISDQQPKDPAVLFDDLNVCLICLGRSPAYPSFDDPKANPDGNNQPAGPLIDTDEI